MEWLYGNPEQGDSEALATWTSVRVSFTAPFLLFACMICFNVVIACRLYCFNVDVFVFGKKLLRAYVFCLYYMPNWNKVLLTYLLAAKVAAEPSCVQVWSHDTIFHLIFPCDMLSAWCEHKSRMKTPFQNRLVFYFHRQSDENRIMGTGKEILSNFNWRINLVNILMFICSLI